MFARVKHGGNKKHPHDYLHVVEAYRDGGKPKQRVMANLGRLDRLVESGQLDNLIEKLANFSQRVRVLRQARTPEVKSCRTKLWGPQLVFGRLWQRQLDEQGIDMSWPDLMHDLEQVQAVDLTLDGRGWRVRTDLPGHAHAAFRAAGVRPPPRIAPLADEQV